MTISPLLWYNRSTVKRGDIMFLDAKELKSILTVEDVRVIIMDLVGEGCVSQSSEYDIYMTFNKNLDPSDGSPKLYFYYETMNFYCYTNNESYDIISLIKTRWELEGRDDFEFQDILHYIKSVLGLSEGELTNKGKLHQPEWKRALNKYKNTNKSKNITTLGMKVYDKNVLSNCLPLYHKSFLDDNITKETMNIFGIGYYPPNRQITIPVFSEHGDLMGVHCRNTDVNLVEKGFKYLPLQTCSEHYKFKTSDVLYGLNVTATHIRNSKQVILLEAPKGVLQSYSYGYKNCVAMFGLSLSDNNRDEILKLGVNEVVIGIDKDYVEYDEKFNEYIKRVKKIANRFKGFVNVSVLYDKDNLLGYKESPTDRGVNVYENLINNRIILK